VSDDRLPDGKFAPGKSFNPATQFKPGVSGNPLGVRVERRQIVELARKSMPKAIERARQILDDDTAEPRMWLEAGKFILSSSGIGESFERKRDKDKPTLLEALTVDEIRALARQSLAEEARQDMAADDDDDDDDGAAPH
jgi:hypothetical protein